MSEMLEVRATVHVCMERLALILTKARDCSISDIAQVQVVKNNAARFRSTE